MDNFAYIALDDSDFIKLIINVLYSEPTYLNYFFNTTETISSASVVTTTVLFISQHWVKKHELFLQWQTLVHY